MRNEYEINQIVARIQHEIKKNNAKAKESNSSQKVFVYNLKDFKGK